jgi:hypothetical protein
MTRLALGFVSKRFKKRDMHDFRQRMPIDGRIENTNMNYYASSNRSERREVRSSVVRGWRI